VSQTTRITRITAQDFRGYKALDLRVNSDLIALIGDNGAGKTNLLEALSLFSPGRGLRRADITDMARQSGQGKASRFSLSLSVDYEGAEHRFGMGWERENNSLSGKRVYRLDGAKATSAQEFSEYLRFIWLTPDMDGLFRGSAGDRRRFLDRLVLATDVSHGRRVQALERALSTRNRLLDEQADPQWCTAVEREIAEHGIAVAAARAETLSRLSTLMLSRRDEESLFPWAMLSLEGEVDTWLTHMSALDAEDHYRQRLHETRARDRAAGRTLTGAHTSDLHVVHGPKHIVAHLASTGEQKALLTGLVLAHAQLTRQISGVTPLLLLDEVAAHLDPSRRAALYQELIRLECQVWMTGTDAQLFEALPASALKMQVSEGNVTPLLKSDLKMSQRSPKSDLH
jgi:DNA replication and repair protein RecF